MKRRAVVQTDRRARREPADEPVPHHPAARREEQQSLIGREIAMQQLFLAMLQQRAADAVHDALRHAGRAGRKHDVERRRERQANEIAQRRRMCQQGLEGARSGRQCRRRDAGFVESPSCCARSASAAQLRRVARCSRTICRRSDSRRSRSAASVRSDRNDRRWPTCRSPANTNSTRAPSAVVASIATTVSIRFGTIAATRSPASMPRSRKMCGDRCDASREDRQTSANRDCPTRRDRSARRRRRVRCSRFSAKLMRASGNQRVPGIRSRSSDDDVAAIADDRRRSPRARARTASGDSTDQR